MHRIWSSLVRVLLICPAPFRKRAAAKLARYILDRYATILVTGQEHLDRLKGTNHIFISNHLSNADAIVLDEVLKSFNPVFVAGIKLTRESGSRLMLETFKTIPINPEKADRHALAEAVAAVKRGNSLVVFPEGTRSRSQSMIAAKKGIVLVAKMANVAIVPIGLQGTEKLLPINDKDMNQEFFHSAAVEVNIGKPVHLPPIEDHETKKDWEERCLDYLMHCIASLLAPEYRGVYRDPESVEGEMKDEGI